MCRFCVITIVLLVSGCAQQLAVTYYSDPPGAVLYETPTNTRFGYTPFTLYYKVSDAERKEGRKRLYGTTVKWISGASASYSYIDADLNRFGYNQSVRFTRPDNVPGREADERFAFDLSNQRTQQQYQNRQLNLQKQQVDLQKKQLEEQKKQNQPEPYQAPIPRTTTSRCGWEFGEWVCRTQ